MTEQSPAIAATDGAGVPEVSIVAGGAAFRMRYLKDVVAKWVVFVGGLGVIAALLLIFFYLITQVIPLFRSPTLSAFAPYSETEGGATLYSAVEEHGEMGMRVAADGVVRFFDVRTGAAITSVPLTRGAATVTAVSEVSADRGLLAAALSDGTVLLFAHRYEETFPDGKRVLTPSVTYPVGEVPIAFLPAAATALAVVGDSDATVLAGTDAAGAVHLKKIATSENPITGEKTTEASADVQFTPPVTAQQLLLDPTLHTMYVLDREHGRIAYYQLDGSAAAVLVDTVDVRAAIVDARMLAGGISLVIARADGHIEQYFPAHKADGTTSYLAHVRDFTLPSGGKPTTIGVEQRRRTFAVGDDAGRVSLFYATSDRLLASQKLLDAPVTRIAFNPRAQLILASSADGRMHAVKVANEHPEFSFASLWNKVWYESYDAPQWLWQSSSASADFEPKFSFTPLAFGTLKGAFYAMIFAIPLAVMGAIFVANFMSPQLRQVVKPTVELLAALPSVILGFLAGLWLAPFVENNLPGMFLLLLLMPLSIPLFGYLWLRVPERTRQRVPAGYEAALLVPVVAFVTWFCFALAKPIEALAFHGNMQDWMDHTLGIHYTQRNALVVGIAMGVAVIPVIFSIAEDAIFSVPRQLSLGSLALGASPWQTLVGVVLPTASPGIFSAIMIGLGRAVGETMIVLMATGNTPVTDASLFTGMRTLSANIAVEMPESEVGSTHFRLLFLAGLVLFIFTFFFNTLAEVVRNRLRRRYASI